MAAKAAMTGTPCPTVDYDGTPCGGEMDYMGIDVYTSSDGEDFDLRRYTCDECGQMVYMQVND